jgi:hypothetical protein
MNEADAADTLHVSGIEIAAEEAPPMLQLGRDESGLLRSDELRQMRLPMHVLIEPLEDLRQFRRYVFPEGAKLLADSAVDAHECEPFHKQQIVLQSIFPSNRRKALAN